MDSYEAARGPHFCALFDEVWGQTGFPTKRVAYITSHDSDNDKDTAVVQKQMQQLQDGLELDVCQRINLSPMTTSSSSSSSSRKKCDPDQLRDAIESLKPSILWIAPHENAYLLRHTMRIHNFDDMVKGLCGPSSGNACLLVGEGAGALCAGANMAVATLRGDEAKACPELQFRGLSVLGPRRSVSFAKPLAHDQEALEQLQTKLATMPLYEPDRDTTTFLNPKQVYIYSQLEGGTDTTKLVMNPYQKGAIEQFETSSLKPVPPLSFGGRSDDGNGSSVARECTGEPSEDPSRTVRLFNDYW